MPDTAAACPFCEAQVGQAVTATEAQARTHVEGHLPRHHEEVFSIKDGECRCECPRCYVDDECVCADCTYDHDHSRRAAK